MPTKEPLIFRMKLQKATALIKNGVDTEGIATWADLGAGEGLFTTALARLLKQGSKIYAVDENSGILLKINSVPGIDITKLVANFEKDNLPFASLDGILMANALHYVKDKIAFLNKARNWMKVDALFLIVEYDTDKSNRWVPYPISFTSCEKMIGDLGWVTEKIGEESSLYNNAGMYAATIRFNHSQ